MRLQYVSVCGFRGFRDPTRIDLAPGFTVLVGPNGSGKSTICDAIEFALLGRIRPSSMHTEKGESIHDYLWWRGAGTAKDSYVEVGFVTDSGELLHFRRSSTTASHAIPAELLRGLIADGSSVDEPLVQLCRTALLRDEDITRLSVDLPEADRFNFVRTALGSADFAVAEAKAKAVGDYLVQQLAVAQQAYEMHRNAVTDLTAKLSALRAEATRATGLDRVEQSLRKLLNSPATLLSDLSREAESAVAQARTRADALTRLYSDLSRLRDRLKTQAGEQSERQISVLSKQTGDRELELNAAEADLAKATALLQEVQQTAPRTVSLALLREHGSRFGLVDGHCPLCGSALTEEHFASHLQSLKDVIDTQNAELVARSSHAASARTRVDSLRTDLVRRRAELATLSSARSALLAEIASTAEQLLPYGVSPTDDISQTLLSTGNTIESLRARSQELEAALSALRASQAASQVEEREIELDGARAQLAVADRALFRLNAAEATIKESVRTIRRVQGELVDEQLAALSPLLAELFQRLRPHVDWQTVRYNLRGDVRRMLSLEVGDGLNPSFVFSSGQRRAAGLAFLLAIHLSRAWCGLRTLILDDPVQHVDDYRALHLVEVLSAIRREHRQVVCTVEDSALADLLARRLRSTDGESGAVIRLGYASGTGAYIVDRREVSPHERRVLVA